MPERVKQLFRYATRQNRRKNGGQNPIAFAANGGQPLVLDKVGMLNRLILQFRGTITLSGAGAATDLSPWNLLARIKVNLNGAALGLWDTSGYGAYVSNMLISRGWRPDAAGQGNTTPDADIHAAPRASGANVWVITWILPIAANQGSNFETGLINLQSPEITATVEPTFCALTDVDALCTAITGNLHVYTEYFEIPDPNIADLPPVIAVRTMEDFLPVGAVGDNPYTVPRGGNLMSLLHFVRLNGARSNSYDSARLVFNKATTPYLQERQLLRILNREATELDFPTGVFAWDFWRSGESIGSGDNRDFIDTEELSTLESIVTISAGATLGANNNTFNNVRRIMQSFQA